MAVKYDEDMVSDFLKGEPEDSNKRKMFDFMFKAITKSVETMLTGAEISSLSIPQEHREEFKKYFIYNVAVCLIFNIGYDEEFLKESIDSALIQLENINKQKAKESKEA